jgi:hypothetical protein
MKKNMFFWGILLAVFAIFASCESGGGGSGTVDPVSSDYSGAIFKGPFLVGSSVQVQELDSSLEQTGSAFVGDITSNTGEYDISGVPFGGVVELIATGYYFDEVSGQTTSSMMMLRALTDKTGTVNVNVATAIERDRVRHLVQAGSSFTDAKTQAITELWLQFGWVPTALDTTAINIGGPDGDRLLALSAMLATDPDGFGSRAASDVNALITTLRIDFEDGTLSTEHKKSLRDSALRVTPETVQENLINYFDGLGYSVAVPNSGNALNAFVDSLPEEARAERGLLVPENGGKTIAETAGTGYSTDFYIPTGETITITAIYPGYLNDCPLYCPAGDFTETGTGVYTATGDGTPKRIDYWFPRIIETSGESYPYTMSIVVTGALSYTVQFTISE